MHKHRKNGLYRRAALRLLAFAALYFSCFGGALQAAPGPGEAAPKKIFYLILMSGANISELAGAHPENISKMVNGGSSAILSSRAQSRYNLASAYFSINTSNYAKCKRGCNLGFNELEVLPGNIPALFRFATSTGIMPEPFSVLNLFRTVKPIRRNVNYMYPGQPGLLGNALGDAVVDVYVFGNSDIIGSKGYNYRREVSIVGMDTSGITRYGDVSPDMIARRKDFPLGLSLDERELMRKIDEIKRGPALVIIELSDIQRLDSIMSSKVLSAQFQARGTDWQEAYFLTTVARSDGIVGAVMDKARAQGGRVMFALVRGSPAMRFDGLVSLYGDGVPPGWLTSNTTHRRGFVSIIDITPTIISYFGVGMPDKVYGKEITPFLHPASVSIEQIDAKAGALYFMDFRLRPMFIRIYCIAIIILLVFMLVTGGGSDKGMKLVRILFYFIALQPLSSCVTSFFPYEKVGVIFALATFAALLISVILAHLMRSWESPVVFIALAFSTALLFDYLSGCGMPLNSIFGYSTHYAGRFYGIGNIQMAQLISAVSVVVAWITQIKKTPLWTKSAVAAFGGLICCALMAAGANFGGIVAALATFALMAIYFFVRKLTVKSYLMLGSLSLVFLVALIAASHFIPLVAQTHFGVFFGKLYIGDFSYVLMILKGKAKLLLTSFFGVYWDLLLIAILSCVGGIYMRNRSEAVALFKARPELYSVGKALLYGGVVGFLFNDSGVSVTVNMWLYWIFAFLLILAQRKFEPGEIEPRDAALAENNGSPEAAV